VCLDDQLATVSFVLCCDYYHRCTYASKQYNMPIPLRPQLRQRSLDDIDWSKEIGRELVAYETLSARRLSELFNRADKC